MDFQALTGRQVKPPFVPVLKNEEDLRYFEYDQFDQDIQFSHVDSVKTKMIKRFTKKFDQFEDHCEEGEDEYE